MFLVYFFISPHKYFRDSQFSQQLATDYNNYHLHIKQRGDILKKIFLWGIIGIIFLVVIIPMFTLFIFNNFNSPQVEITSIETAINVFNHKTGKLMRMDLEEYVQGVVAAEMPASFELEALKAQALAARTYAYKRMIKPDERVKKLHPEADVVTDHTICQAWVSNDELKERWGFWDYRKYKSKIVKAVQATKGKILVYDQQIIDPVYHASCGGGRTENSGEVWNHNFPYLTSVACISHEDKHYRDTKTIPMRNIDVALGTNLAAIPASKLMGSSSYIKVLEATGAGRVKSINIGGKIYSGVEIRTKLGLKSTWFNWQINENSITFITRGYGHAVGMCQYGANQFAKSGKTYEQIVKHYYQGIEIIQLKSKK